MTTTTVPEAAASEPESAVIPTKKIYKQPIGRSVSTSLSSGWGRVLVWAIALIWLIPILGIFVSSFRPEQDVKTSGWWKWFTNPNVTLSNYKAVLGSGSGGDNLWHFVLNSLEITIPSVILSIGIATLAAYAFSWMQFPGRDWLFVATVAMLMVPLQMALIPMLQLLVRGDVFGVHIIPWQHFGIHVTSGIYGVWFAHVCFGMPFCIFIMRWLGTNTLSIRTEFEPLPPSPTVRPPPQSSRISTWSAVITKMCFWPSGSSPTPIMNGTLARAISWLAMVWKPLWPWPPYSFG